MDNDHPNLTNDVFDLKNFKGVAYSPEFFKGGFWYET